MQFRGSIRDITDDTNATRAYAILGFSWGFGGVMGPVRRLVPALTGSCVDWSLLLLMGQILGGVFESPVENFPNIFLSEIGESKVQFA